MLTFFLAVLTGIGLGLQAAIQPGPLMAVILGESFHGGRRRGVRFGLIPLWTDPPVIILALFIVAHVPEPALGVISFLGGAILIRMGILGLRESDEHDRLHSEVAASQSYRTAVAMNFLNPSLYIYAFTIHSIQILRCWESGILSVVGYLAAFFIAMFAVNSSIAIAAGTFRTRISERFLRLINRILSYFLFLMAILFILRGFLFLI